MLKIKVILTGGTIDANRIMKGGEYEFTKSHVKDFLSQQFGNHIEMEFKELFLKDSTQINSFDRLEIVEEITNSHQDLILVTHGTDTMVETAKYLNKNIKNKKIVMVGSMTLLNVEPKESCFNLGFAISQLSTLRKNGVFIAMNGELFKHNNVRKNYEKLCFEQIKSR
jgi:L-asparaginase